MLTSADLLMPEPIAFNFEMDT